MKTYDIYYHGTYSQKKGFNCASLFFHNGEEIDYMEKSIPNLDSEMWGGSCTYPAATEALYYFYQQIWERDDCIIRILGSNKVCIGHISGKYAVKGGNYVQYLEDFFKQQEVFEGIPTFEFDWVHSEENPAYELSKLILKENEIDEEARKLFAAKEADAAIERMYNGKEDWEP